MKDESKISIRKIEEENIEAAVFQTLEDIGAKNMMKTGMKVLLKPNLLIAKKPERGVTTHPEIVRAVIHWVQQFDPEKIYVGDSSGGLKPGVTQGVLNESGIQKVCEEEDVESVSFSKTQRKDYDVPNPLVMDHLVSTDLLEKVDLIINLPKIKTHSLCTVTCSVKNMFGTVIIGNKPKTHLKYPKFEDFSAALADIYSVSQPQLTIVDGYLCQEGNGPSAGDVVKMDIVLAGYNGVAIDATVCKIIGVNPYDIIHLVKCQEKGIGTLDLENNYQIVGESLDSVARKFKLPTSTGRGIPIPGKLADFLSKHVFMPRISFDQEKCVLCGTCWRDCPADALSKPENMDPKHYTPNWDKNKCIFCYCCSELCPEEAIEFDVNIAKNIFTSKLKYLVIGVLGLLSLLIWLIVYFA